MFFALLWDSWIIIWNFVAQMCNSGLGWGVLGSGKLWDLILSCDIKRDSMKPEDDLWCEVTTNKPSHLQMSSFECIFWKINYEYAGTELIWTLFFLVSNRVKRLLKVKLLDGIRILILTLYKLVFFSLHILKHSNVKGKNKGMCCYLYIFSTKFLILSQEISHCLSEG